MKAFTFVALVAMLALAAVASVHVPSPQATKSEVIWESLFAPPYLMEVEIALNIQCVAPNLCFIPGGSNGAGFGMYKFNGQRDGQLIRMTEPNMTMMIMTSAMGGSAEQPVGAFGGLGLLSASVGVQYLKDYNTWEPSLVEGLEFIITTQSMAATEAGQHIIAVDNGAGTTQMFFSQDAGKTFAVIDLKKLPKPNNCSSAGYVSMVDDKTWYLTFGSFPQNRAPPTGQPSRLKLLQRKNQRVAVVQDMVTKKTQIELINPFDENQENLDNYVCLEYSAMILKTTDAGQTWETQYDAGAGAQFTFNQIDCVDANNCVAVASGMPSKVDPSVVPNNRIFRTTDGKTWKQVFEVEGGSTSITFLNAITYAGPSEVWAAGSVQSKTSTAGIFYHSKDGGLTWNLYPHQIPDMAEVMDLSFSGGVGYAVAMTEFKTANVIKYANQPFYGYFTQSHCPFKGCSLLCQNATFPQGECLGAQGGSAMAFCTPEGVKQQIYETTSCVGSYKTYVQPINQCLNGTNGFFENYCDTNTGVHARTSQLRF